MKCFKKANWDVNLKREAIVKISFNYHNRFLSNKMHKSVVNLEANCKK